MSEILITRRGGFGGAVTNVLVVYVKEAGATVTVTKSAETYSNLTDSAGYAYFTNLGEGTWTVSAVNSSSHPAPSTPTVTITATQTSYYIIIGFEFWLYDNSYADTTLNECIENSGGWAGALQSPKITTSLDTRWTGGGNGYAQNSFDMSQYTTLSARVHLSNGYSGNKLQVKASNKSTVLAEAQFVAQKNSQWLTLDISSITAVGYVFVQANTNDVIGVEKCYLS